MADDLGSEVQTLHDSRQAIVKAQVVGGDRPAGQARSTDELLRDFSMAGALEPPYEPDVLAMLLEHSNSLRQNVDSYVVNVHAHGHRFEPIIDLAADDANVKIGNLLWERKLRDNAATYEDPNAQVELPTEDEILAARKELEEKMRAERARLKRFFDNCSLDVSFESLRMVTGQDKEAIGNGYWEVLRDASGRVAQFNYIPAFTMRLMPLDKSATDVEEKVRVDDVTWGEITRAKHFRRYVQILEEGCAPVYFREFGDPRLISAKTGHVHRDMEQMAEIDGPGARAATECIHFKIPSPRSPYGVPRWIGQLLSVLGSRQVDEVNFNYFDNKSVPPLLVTVADGRMTDEAVERMRTHIDTEIKGKKNFHKILVLEATTAEMPGQQHSGRAKITVQPLTMAQHNDALFQKYDERNLDKVGMAFRLPRMLRGDIRDFNRATADAALEFAEMQVFVPEREDFDFVMNRRVLPMLGVRFWRFKSNSPTLTDPMEQGKLIVDMVKEGVLIPAEGRQEAEKVLNRELPTLGAGWTKQPISLTLAGIQPPPETMPETEGGEGEEEVPTEPETPEIALTGTDLASIVTVNEVREQHGLGALKLQDGSDDPDGFLTVAEFKAKKTKAGEVTGEAEGEQATPEAKSGDGAVPDIGDRGGVVMPEEDVDEEERDTGTTLKRRVVRDAAYLLQLRNAMEEQEAIEAEREFHEARAAEVAEGGE